MPLIDLKTDLKSLKYGKDRPGGGDSGQPYQKVDINRVDSGFNRFRMTKFDDGLVRGGVVGAVNASIVDTLRIGKFLKDFPKGPLFITKQVGLQLSNPIIEHKTNFPTNKPTRGQGLFNNIGNFISNIANKILNAVGPTRIYNLGINTLAQIPVNAFGQHIQRHGFTPRRNDDNLYFKVVQFNNNEANNRLTQLRSILGNTNNIRTYLGGPSSIYGIGTTTIQRRGKFININQDTTASPWATSKEINDSSYVQSSAKNKISTSNLKIGVDLGLSKKTFSKLAGDLKIPIDPSGSAAYDRIASKNDPSDNKYKAISQEASASAKMRTPDDFVGASKFASSSLSTTTFTDLTSISNKPLTLDDKIASASDPKNIVYKAIDQEASASAKMRIPDEFVGASKFVSSSLSTTTFADLTSTDNKPSTLNAKLYPEYASNSVSASHIVSASSDLGLSKLGGISTGSIGKENNVISYTTPSQKKYAELRKKVDTPTSGSIFKYNDVKNTSLGTSSNVDDYNGVINAYTNKAISYNNGIDKPFVISGTWATKNREVRVGSGRRDSLNLTPIFEAPAGTISDVPPITIPNTRAQTINDLVKFRIQALNGDDPSVADYMIFRAYITQYSDNTDATWNPIKYAGRGEDFYIYGGFSRKIQIGFKVAALSAEEMKPMYQKLNFLMSNLMPDYKDDLLMRGPLVKMTVGNWIDGQDGILTSVGYTVPQDSPWEISLGDQQLILPHIVEVSLGFTPIGSQTKGVNLISSKSQVISNIAQNANADVNYIG
jgi:hypothetical protein